MSPRKSSTRLESGSPISGAGLRGRLSRGIGWNLAGAVFNQGSTFLVNVFLANDLGRTVFGKYAILQSTVLMLATLAQLACGYTATKYVAEFRTSDPSRAGRVLGLCYLVAAAMAFVAALLMLTAAPWIAGSILHVPSLVPTLRIASGAVLFTVLNGFLMGALAGLEDYRKLAAAFVASGICYVVFCGAGTLLAGLDGAVVGLGLSGLAQWFFLRAAVRAACAKQAIVIDWAGAWSERRIVATFTLPAALSGFVSMPAFWLANALVVRSADGLSQIALYGAANSFRTIVLFAPAIVNNVGMSLINHQRGLRDDRRYSKLFWANFGLTAGAVAAGAVVIVALGPRILRVFGRDFMVGSNVLNVLMLAAIAEAACLAVYQAIQSRGKLWLSFVAVSLPRDVSIVVLAYFLAPRSGALGLSWAYAIGWCFALAAVMVVVATGRLSSRTHEPAHFPSGAAP